VLFLGVALGALGSLCLQSILLIIVFAFHALVDCKGSSCCQKETAKREENRN
jgi:hypothetical protein